MIDNADVLRDPAGAGSPGECRNPAPTRETLESVLGSLDALLSTLADGEVEADPIAHALIAGARVGLAVALGAP